MGNKARLLLIDHRPEHLRQPVLRLQLEGYQVDEADSGPRGLDAMREGVYDLVLLDAELPDTDGWETLREMRADPQLKDTKVIVFMAKQGETGKLALVPVDAELRRPFSMGELLTTVERVLES
ncbi:MAG: response regulator [Actinomycetota bacterium]